MKIIQKAVNTFKDKERRVILKNFLSLLFLQGANYILPLLILPYLVRVLGVEKFGLVMFAQSLAIFFTVFVDFGFNISGTREIALAKQDQQKRGELFLAIMTIKFCLIIIAFAILYIVVNTFSRFSVDVNIYLLSFGVVIGQALFPVWFFHGIEKMKVVTFINILAKLIFTLLIFVLVKTKSDYIMVPVYNSLGFIISGLIGFFISFKYLKISIPKFKLIKQLLFDSTSLFISNFATSLYTASNVFVIGLFLGDIVAGIYSSMEKLILAVKNVYIPVYQAIYPWLSRQSEKFKTEVIHKLTPVIFILSASITIFILTLSKTILSIIYNNDDITQYANIFRILSFISVFSAFNMLYNMLYFPAVKRYNIRMRIMIFGGLFNISVNLIIVQIFGIYGVTIVVTFTELLLAIIGYYFFNRLSKPRQFNESIQENI